MLCLAPLTLWVRFAFGNPLLFNLLLWLPVHYSDQCFLFWILVWFIDEVTNLLFWCWGP